MRNLMILPPSTARLLGLLPILAALGYALFRVYSLAASIVPNFGG